jgi:hypothetical protein
LTAKYARIALNSSCRDFGRSIRMLACDPT